MMADWQHLVGTPYQWGGRDPASGLDCWGLVRLLHPGLPDYAATDSTDASAQMDSERARYRRVESPQVGDVLLFGRGRPRHVGVLVLPGRVLHAAKTVGVALESLAAMRQTYSQIRAYRP